MASSQMMSQTASRPSVVLVSSTLDCYDADKDLNIVRGWFEMVNAPLTEAASLAQLEKEAKDKTGKPESRMEEYFKTAMKSTKSVSGLWKAENVVVLMYTNDSDASAFFREYNKASTGRNWQPYKVYTAILMSALHKLANIRPVPQGTSLYRGINCKLDPPKAKRIFWKAFTSTSMNYQTAKDFAGPNGIVLEFQAPISRYAAQVGELATYQEEEVILLPFEAFDFLNADSGGFHFKTSKTQPLLASSYIHDEL